MARKQFPPERDTRPDLRRSKGPKPSTTHQSGPAPKEYRARAEAPTVPPPPTRREGSSARPPKGARNSNVRKTGTAPPAATVDEVTADLSRDPRREPEEE